MWTNGRTLIAYQRNDLSFGRALHDTVGSLIDTEGRLAHTASILVRARDNPSRRIRDTLYVRCYQRVRRGECLCAYEVQDDATLNIGMKSVHYLVDGRVPVPPVNVQDIDIRRAKVLETGFDRVPQALGTVPRVRRPFDGVRLEPSA